MNKDEEHLINKTAFDYQMLIDKAMKINHKQSRPKKWMLSLSTIDQKGGCFFCHRQASLELDRIIRERQGGGSNPANLIAVCSDCFKKRMAYDPLAWCQGDEKKITRRQMALEASLIHPLPVVFKDKKTNKKHLRKRWDYLRFVVFAQHTNDGLVLLWTIHIGIPPFVLARLRATGEAIQTTNTQWKNIIVPTHKVKDVCEFLIEHNGLIRCLDNETMERWPLLKCETDMKTMLRQKKTHQ